MRRFVRGLTFIEVLIALAILSLALLALIPLFTLGVRVNASSNQLGAANTLAKEKLEELIQYPSTNDRLCPASATALITDSSNNALYCANDLPTWYQPSTGATSRLTPSPGAGWYPYPCTRTYTVQAFLLTDLSTPVSMSRAAEALPIPYYGVKLVTVSVQPSGGPFPGLRATKQSAWVKYRDAS